MIDAVNLRHQGPNTKAAWRAVEIVPAIYLFPLIAVNNSGSSPLEMTEAMKTRNTIGRSFRFAIPH